MASRREDVVTTGVGLGGVASARALSHSALEAAYDKGPRPKVWAERKILTRKPMKGKGRLAAATGLLTVSLPPAAVGMNNLMHRPSSKPIIKSEQTRSKSLWREARQGVKSSLQQRNDTIAERTPIHRQAQSYGVGTLTGSAAGGLTGLALKKAPKLHGGIKAGIIGVTGITAGAATLPAQSRLMQATSHGQYKVTPTGVVRTKRKVVRPSRKATRVARVGGVEVPSRVGKASWPFFRTGKKLLKVPKRTMTVKPGHSMWDTPDDGVAVGNFTVRNFRRRPIGGLDYRDDVISSIGVNPGYRRRGVATHLLEEARKVRPNLRHDVNRTANGDAWANAVERKRGRVPVESHRERIARQLKEGVDPSQIAYPVRKGDYPGQDLSRGQKRARVMAAGATPLIGDLVAARQAGSMAPPNLRRKTEALQLGGSVTGATAGFTAGAYGGAALARKIPSVQERADKINAKITERVRNPIASGKSKVAHRVHSSLGERVDARAAREGPGLIGRKVAQAASHPHPAVARVGRGLIRAHAPLAGPVAAGAAALGGMIGQSAGSTALSTATYGHALNLEDKQRKARVGKSQHNRHGSRVSKLAPAPALTKREQKVTARRKEQSAALSVAGATGSLAAVGSGLASKIPHLKPTTARRLGRASVPILTGSAGLGAVNSLIYANIQHKEAAAARKAAGVPVTAAKAFRMPRVTPVRMGRAGSMRSGYLRKTGNRTVSVRGAYG